MLLVHVSEKGSCVWYCVGGVAGSLSREDGEEEDVLSSFLFLVGEDGGCGRGTAGVAMETGLCAATNARVVSWGAAAHAGCVLRSMSFHMASITPRAAKVHQRSFSLSKRTGPPSGLTRRTEPSILPGVPSDPGTTTALSVES